jgi:hypothetical protein
MMKLDCCARLEHYLTIIRSLHCHFLLKVVHSVRCPGLVVSASNVGTQLTLQSATGEDSTKWSFRSDGLIESIKFPVFAIGGNGSNIVLVSISDGNAQTWNKVNTRLMTNTVPSNSDWGNNWKIDFVEDFAGSLPIYNANNPTQTCYQIHEGFSQSFENIAQGIVIDDETDEDQCRQSRELLGSDRDYPYDTEVVDKFKDMACGLEFDTYDHMTEPLSAPPVFDEVEFEAPEYNNELHDKLDAISQIPLCSGRRYALLIVFILFQ